MVYLQTSNLLNRHWSVIANAVLEMDFRPLYLKAFEIALSPCLPVPLYDMEEYAAQYQDHPMPRDPCTVMQLEEYLSWVTFYELIMRSTHTLGAIDTDPADGESLEEFFGREP